MLTAVLAGCGVLVDVLNGVGCGDYMWLLYDGAHRRSMTRHAHIDITNAAIINNFPCILNKSQ